MWIKQCFVFSILLLVIFCGSLFAEDFSAEPGGLVFQSKCAMCHTVGQGDNIGPDLQGVLKRRDRSWLFSFIKDPRLHLDAGDEIANELFEKYMVRMVDMGLTDAETESILQYIENSSS